VRGVDGEPECPRVTPSMLRRADLMCRRRLAREYAGGKRNANKSADARFSVSNRISEDARLAQPELGWRTHLDDVDVDLVADIGIAIELPDGGRELRALRLGSRHPSAPLLDDAQLRFALVRTEAWAPHQLTIIAADVIERDTEYHAPDLPAARADARSWIIERIELVQQLAADGRSRAGADCMGCPFIAGCDQFPT
jgi:hypothetical protein